MDEAQLMDFVHKAVGDVGARLAGSMVVIGDRLGLYGAMAGAGPITSAALAEKTGTSERYVREWLGALPDERASTMRRPTPTTSRAHWSSS
jgi:hypothetical protein